jgi:phosphoketolase
MAAIDDRFTATVEANPQLRPRVGNPDEMRSNRMLKTLERLKFRVTAPEPGIPEATDGAVITALNEEAIASAALGNKGGLNIIVSYEAFAAKMHGVVRQEIIFADHQNAVGTPPGWLSVPLVVTSHTWENAKNEQSHQDPAMAELMLGEPSDVSRVLFPIDANSAAAVMEAVYTTRGQIWTLVVPKVATLPDLMTEAEARTLVRDGAARLEWAGGDPDRARVILTAVGAYQLLEILKASERLTTRGIEHAVVAMLEPGRFRVPRSERERRHAASEDVRHRLYPEGVPARLFLTHTRPEPVLGALRPLDSGGSTVALGFTNHGGTLSVRGMLHVNRATWAHCLAAIAPLLGIERTALLSSEEAAALDGHRTPEGVIL